jgi:hypothetical protein
MNADTKVTIFASVCALMRRLAKRSFLLDRLHDLLQHDLGEHHSECQQ